MKVVVLLLRHQNTKETNVKYSRKENKYVDNELCGPSIWKWVFEVYRVTNAIHAWFRNCKILISATYTNSWQKNKHSLVILDHFFTSQGFRMLYSPHEPHISYPRISDPLLFSQSHHFLIFSQSNVNLMKIIFNIYSLSFTVHTYPPVLMQLVSISCPSMFTVFGKTPPIGGVTA